MSQEKEEATFEKGDRIQVARGRKVPIGTLGTVFWVGDNQWGDGKRLGIEGDDGETYWTAAKNVDPTNEMPLTIEPPKKDATVHFIEGQTEHTGEVFWVGPAKTGNGTRVGVRCSDGETRWVDARKLQVAPVADGEEAPF